VASPSSVEHPYFEEWVSYRYLIVAYVTSLLRCEVPGVGENRNQKSGYKSMKTLFGSRQDLIAYKAFTLRSSRGLGRS
jgi:oligoribonuclease (3'-5' exoribonuclease)